MMIRIQEINIFCKNSDKLQELAVFHDYEVIDTLTNIMN